MTVRSRYNYVMSTITVQDIQKDLSGFLRRVEAGEAFLVVRNERAVAEVRPVAPPNLQLRPYGLAAGQFSVSDDFDAPLPADILADFEGA